MDQTNLDNYSSQNDQFNTTQNQSNDNKLTIDPSFLDKEDINPYNDNIKAIITNLDRLSDILNPIKFNPTWMNLNTELNKNSNDIDTKLSEIYNIYSNEYKSISIRASMLEDKIKLALQTCKSEQQNPEGDVIYTGVFTWLEKDGPKLMRTIIDLKDKVE